MHIIVGVASRHGSTRSIADRLGDRLTARGHSVELVDLTARHRTDVAGADAVVVGSAIYEKRWIKQARAFVLDNAVMLQHVPVWLFSSGPLAPGEGPGVHERQIDELVHAVDAVEHRVFTGRLDRDELSRVERWIVDVVQVRAGDFRDWSAIDAWADEISDHLAASERERTAPA